MRLLAGLLTISLLQAQSGFVPERLAKIAPAMKEQVEAGKMSGGVGLVIRNGKVAYF